MPLFETKKLEYNFRPQMPFYKIILYNFLIIVLGINLPPRKNWLTKQDLLNFKKNIEIGDVVLVGNLRTLFAKLAGGVLTHSMIYVGNDKFINSTIDGVGYLTLKNVFLKYDTLTILRVPKTKKIKNRDEIIKKAINFAKKRIKKPYDYELSHRKESFFCTKLVNEAFLNSGFDTGLNSVDKPYLKVLKPMDFFNSNFNLVHFSKNLKKEDNKIFLNQKKHTIFKFNK